jgi:hypothetical protein
MILTTYIRQGDGLLHDLWQVHGHLASLNLLEVEGIMRAGSFCGNSN